VTSLRNRIAQTVASLALEAAEIGRDAQQARDDGNLVLRDVRLAEARGVIHACKVLSNVLQEEPA